VCAVLRFLLCTPIFAPHQLPFLTPKTSEAQEVTNSLLIFHSK
jgi:hypothetical protein